MLSSFVLMIALLRSLLLGCWAFVSLHRLLYSTIDKAVDAFAMIFRMGFDYILFTFWYCQIYAVVRLCNPTVLGFLLRL